MTTSTTPTTQDQLNQLGHKAEVDARKLLTLKAKKQGEIAQLELDLAEHLRVLRNIKPDSDVLTELGAAKTTAIPKAPAHVTAGNSSFWARLTGQEKKPHRRKVVQTGVNDDGDSGITIDDVKDKAPVVIGMILGVLIGFVLGNLISNAIYSWDWLSIARTGLTSFTIIVILLFVGGWRGAVIGSRFSKNKQNPTQPHTN